VSTEAAASTGSGQGTAATTATANGQAGSGITVSAQTGSSASDWTTSLSEEVRGYVQNKGFKDPGQVVDSYKNLEKLLGADKAQLLRIPQKEDAPEWNDIWSKLGKPADPTEYKIGDDKGDKNFQEWARKTFFELNVPKKQAETLAAKFNEYSQSVMDAQANQRQQEVVQQDNQLKQEWGKAYEQNIQVGRKAVQAFGFDGPTIEKLEQAMGYAGVMKFMQTLGSKVGEDSFVSSQGQGGFRGAMSPAQAKAQMQSLKGDGDFVKRLTAGDVNARAEWDKLHQYAYPE
jgi:hypothetical protein